VIATATSSRRLVSHLRDGDVAPLYAVSGGKTILATTFEPVTPHTILSTDELLAELETVRRTGIAYSHEEYTPGSACLATAS
jgi:DNA-binding IclR family transcriptional regulator